MLRLVFITSLLLFSLPLAAQDKWQWGFDLYAGSSGERLRENRSLPSEILGYQIWENRNLWSPAVGVGGWAKRQLGRYGALRVGLQYQRLQYIIRETFERYTPNRDLLTNSRERQQITQQALLLPLEGWIYLSRPTRRLRPFVGLQLSLAYFTYGTFRVEHQAYRATPLTPQSAWGALDFRPRDLMLASPWQFLYGMQLGVELDPFTISIWQQYNFRTTQQVYVNNCPFTLCFEDVLRRPEYPSLFRHLQLRLAYRL